ncbi:unnamed protein product [Diatraea saccharalis]|uniref:Uncharacterized protein n=1 Tax=Diatraea saccharalis TaxID=40085 RepID=A0A9N9WFX9_9NEOP|nr:unnamed protein product [Diatraea saccharalis]
MFHTPTQQKKPEVRDPTPVLSPRRGVSTASAVKDKKKGKENAGNTKNGPLSTFTGMGRGYGEEKDRVLFSFFFFLCLNIRPENIVDLPQDALLNWVCPTCMIKQPKGNNSESVARPSTPTTMAEISFNSVTRRKAPAK